MFNYLSNPQLTQEQLAEKVGVSYELIGRVERGAYFPNWLLLIKIAKIFRVKEYTYLLCDIQRRKMKLRKANIFRFFIL